MKLFRRAIFLCVLHSTTRISAAGGLDAGDCHDLLDERFFYATQVRVSNVHCAGERELCLLGDFVTDHLVGPMTLQNSTTQEGEIDICRAIPIAANKEHCPGYLTEHEAADLSFVWNWKGIGKCGIFKPNPDCNIAKLGDTTFRRLMDIQRLRGSRKKDTSVIPDFEERQWLSDDQKATLKSLALKRDKLISSDRHLESVLTEKHFVSEPEIEDIMEKNRGNEKMVLSQILELYSEYESQASLIKSKVQELEQLLTNKLESVFLQGNSLRNDCFLDEEKPQVDIVITLMATEEYAAAYVDEQC